MDLPGLLVGLSGGHWASLRVCGPVRGVGDETISSASAMSLSRRVRNQLRLFHRPAATSDSNFTAGCPRLSHYRRSCPQSHDLQHRRKDGCHLADRRSTSLEGEILIRLYKRLLENKAENPELRCLLLNAARSLLIGPAAAPSN